MRKRSGLTLIEILIAMAILILVVGVMVVFQRDFFSLNLFLEQSLSIQRDAEEVIREIIAELRTASQSNTGGYPLELTASTSLAFYADIDTDPLKERVHYFLDGTSLKKSVVKPAGQPITYSTSTVAQETVMVVLRYMVTTDVPQIFSYYGTFTDPGQAVPLSQPVNPSVIKLVAVDITVDEDPVRLPPPISVGSRVTIRNLRIPQ